MVTKGKWSDLFQYLDHLSNSNFKSAKFIFESDVLLLAPSPVFWEAACRLVQYRPKAFLNSVAKVSRNRVLRGNWYPDFRSMGRISEELKGDEALSARNRFVRYILPLMKSESEINALFDVFHVNSPSDRIVFLREVPSPLHFFQLFTLLRKTDNHGLAVDCCRFLMKQGDDLSYNMASLLKGYFDLESVNGVFSLRLQPYEFSYLETSFPTFEMTIRKI